LFIGCRRCAGFSIVGYGCVVGFDYNFHGVFFIMVVFNWCEGKVKIVTKVIYSIYCAGIFKFIFRVFSKGFKGRVE